MSYQRLPDSEIQKLQNSTRRPMPWALVGILSFVTSSLTLYYQLKLVKNPCLRFVGARYANSHNWLFDERPGCTDDAKTWTEVREYVSAQPSEFLVIFFITFAVVVCLCWIAVKFRQSDPLKRKLGRRNFCMDCQKFQSPKKDKCVTCGKPVEDAALFDSFTN